MVYLIDYGRPFGIEEKIYYNKPIIPVFDDNPFGSGEIIEFKTELECRIFVRKYYPTLYKKLEIVK